MFHGRLAFGSEAASRCFSMRFLGLFQGSPSRSSPPPDWFSVGRSTDNGILMELAATCRSRGSQDRRVSPPEERRFK